MSKIGRRPIEIGSVQLDIKGQEINYKGVHNSGTYVLPDELTVNKQDGHLILEPKKDLSPSQKREMNRIWGLHRALLYNRIRGAETPFERNLDITGLGYKASPSGDSVVFSLGYSHKINFPLPKDVTIETDRTGQKLTLKSFDKELLGRVCSDIRSLRPPEPYKGTGIKYRDETITRKAGKTKA